MSSYSTKSNTALNDNESLLVSIAEACNLLRISRSFVWKLIADGKIRTIKIGRRTLIARSELISLIAAYCSRPHSTLLAKCSQDGV